VSIRSFLVFSTGLSGSSVKIARPNTQRAQFDYGRVPSLFSKYCFAIQYPNINSLQRKDKRMPKFLIERELPGAGKLSPAELRAISQKSCSVLKNLGPQIQWLESYVTQDKIYCVYIAPNEQLVREHATQGGFPANRISEINRIIDPTTAEA